MGAVSKQRNSWTSLRQKNQLVLAFMEEHRGARPEGPPGRDRARLGESAGLKARPSPNS